MLLSVFPTRPNFPTLKYWRFRTLRGSWIKAVSVVAGYIDEALKDTLHDIPPEKSPTDQSRGTKRIPDAPPTYVRQRKKAPQEFERGFQVHEQKPPG
jgi:hypothetical protein